jgi:hypothetical protein
VIWRIWAKSVSRYSVSAPATHAAGGDGAAASAAAAIPVHSEHNANGSSYNDIDNRTANTVESTLDAEQNRLQILVKVVFSKTRFQLVVGLGNNKNENSDTENSNTDIYYSNANSNNANSTLSGSPGVNKSAVSGSTVSTFIRLGPVLKWCVANGMEIVEDYPVGEATLEQVFLQFANKQSGETE